ncbi:hypothetical protein JW979_12800 [bacterium]|nr:hypothetical protein [candidate division CSSED10-310 bacterium]
MRMTFQKLASLILLMLLSLCSCHHYAKVPVTYYKKPLLPDLKEKTFLMAKLQNNCKFCDASRDVEAILMNTMKKENIFKEVITLDREAVPVFDEKDMTTFLDAINNYNWTAWNTPQKGDLLLLGAVFYKTQDFSGYDSEWAVNRYGYRVPVKVWRDRLSYEFHVYFVLMDLTTGESIFNKTYESKDEVEGAADEIAILMNAAEMKSNEFLNSIRGEKVKTQRYLLFR